MISHDSPATTAANRRFIRDAMNGDLLTREHELELARRWRDERDEVALGELVTAYIRFVVGVASKFRNYGLPFGDLIQEGCVGAMQATSRFNPARGLRFSTYARWWIRAAIQDYVLRNWSIVRTGTTTAQKTLFFKLRALRAKLEASPGRGSDAAIQTEIARKFEVSERAVNAMTVRLGAQDQSLNAAVGADSDVEFQDLLIDETSSPEDIVIERREGEKSCVWVEAAMKDLTQREQTIIRDRRLRDGKLTLAVLGKRFGISRERVRQIEREALTKLRHSVERKVGNPFLLGVNAGRAVNA